MVKPHRDTISVHDCQILAHYQFEADQYIITLESKEIADSTRPGQFVHLSVSGMLAMRRPISVMSVDIENGTFDLLYKIVGEGTKQLAERKIGDVLSVIGPIGNGFELTDHKIPLLIGGGVGMPPMIAIAQEIKNSEYYNPYVILGSEVPFPFDTSPSSLIGLHSSKFHTMPLLEEWRVPCGLASLQDYEGVFKGYVTDLAREFLDSLSTNDIKEVEIFTCGPNAMLEAVSKLANEYNLPCQASLEEYMACAVGGCAGCVVEVKTENGPAMKRVCVDGPVFDAKTVFNDFR
ncbi:MAG: dihydroorotate dehydrogenase electron transfer subunit [Thiotrichales bacterium]|jgi:dihydroorotate dehydrogenase electron transfer subunit|nr:dihydroorotate dehydrogenase electron transfer subunit [Thiotrichales bacterium]MBT3854954.1 dihydroorotate dehydrogenase electron transfer subunit [Thiotrichales bacterium]MBT4652898.1 dihydroorotate dehydrogenase electron transfer subunit [Thiotrichales bacterium]MBT5983674.1 dihydroorotate dehydrogenase electron transfer subunit [Thiotrichales bacterium]MBT6771465.1 dihydroorotate dehydrogenase electron transfer subunit [Thiotrichales bacterium]|tara:strand:+ start:256 stop:1128 length:873 start_codon:yes stop_codon:yes gene_type:complete